MKPVRVYLVGKERVSIIKSYTHTYHVRFIKSGKFLEIHKRYLRTWYPKPENQTQKKSTIPKKPLPPQQLNFNF